MLKIVENAQIAVSKTSCERNEMCRFEVIEFYCEKRARTSIEQKAEGNGEKVGRVEEKTQKGKF